MNIDVNNIACCLFEKWYSDIAVKSAVPVIDNMYITANKRNKEPNNRHIKNFLPTVKLLPLIPIIKNIGTNIASKQT